MTKLLGAARRRAAMRNAAGLDASELRGLRFTCLEGCGFCCTFTPEVAAGELARLRSRFPSLPVVASDGGRTRLAFQGGCGACTLLAARRCTAYEDRPAHCRYFPFHVHFGPAPEVLVNRSCRGVEPEPAGDLGSAYLVQVADAAPPGAFEAHAAEAAAVYAEFEANARRAGAWGDAHAAARRALAAGPSLLTPGGLAAAAGGPGAVAALLEDAWEPFGEEDPVSRPFYLTKDLRWLSFRSAKSLVAVEEMQEDGSLAPVERLVKPLGLPRLPEGSLPGLHAVLERLVARKVFAGQVYAAVDELDYAAGVEDAARARVLGLAAELALRAGLLKALGVPEAELPAEAWRFEDSAFLDHPTIGGWL
jgi:Fe-S-cluster containining protein